jgi:hypothetical protein
MSHARDAVSLLLAMSTCVFISFLPFTWDTKLTEVGQLLFQFERMDMDESGGISFAEFVKYLRLDNNNFAGRAFGK